MILDIKSLKVYIISPGENKYRQRVMTVFDRLLDEGFRNITFFKSLVGPNNTASLTNTVLEIFKQELKNDKPFMIVEDDCAFFTKYDKIEVPDNWDALYAGVSLWSYYYPLETLYTQHRPHIYPNSSSVVESYDSNLTRIKAMTSGHAIIYNSREYMRTFIQKMGEISKKIDDLPHDLLLSVMASTFNVYGLKQPMFYQDSTLGGQEDVTKLTFNGECYR
jgi:hypothetical protein